MDEGRLEAADGPDPNQREQAQIKPDDQDAASRIAQLSQMLLASEAKVKEVQTEFDAACEQNEDLMCSAMESDRLLFLAGEDLEEEKCRYSQLEKSSEIELKWLNEQYIAALATASEKTNRAKEASEEADGIRKIAMELEREKEVLEREREQWHKDRRANEEWTRKWAESEKVRSELEGSVKEAQQIIEGLKSSLAEANERVEEEKRATRQFKGERDIFEFQCSQYKSGLWTGAEGENRLDALRMGQLREENEELKGRVDRYKKRAREYESLEKKASSDLKEEMERHKKRVKECERLERELKETEERVRKLEKDKKTMSEKVEEVEDTCDRLQSERNQLKTALNQAKEDEKIAQDKIAEGKREIASLNREVIDIRKKLQIQIRVKEEIAALERERDNLKKKLKGYSETLTGREITFLKDQTNKLERMLGEKLVEEKIMKRKKIEIEEDRRAIDGEREEMRRRSEDMDRTKREMEERRRQMEETRERERADTEKEMERLVSIDKELWERVRTGEEESRLARAEVQEARAQLIRSSEEMAQLRTVNAFLATSSTAGQLYEELQQSRQREQKLNETIEMMAKMASGSKWDEEEDEERREERNEGLRRKRARRDTTKDEVEETEEECRDEERDGLEEGELVDEEEHEQPVADTTPLPSFLQEYISTRVNIA